MITFHEAIQVLAWLAGLTIAWFIFLDVAVPILEKREKRKLENLKRDILDK